MTLLSALRQWVSLSEADSILIIADDTQMPIAVQLQNEYSRTRILPFCAAEAIPAEAAMLTENDLLLAAFSLDTFVYGGGNRLFSPFRKPQWLKAKYVFIRLDISSKSLLQGLSTPKADVISMIEQRGNLLPGRPLRITAPGGTDITMEIHPFATCSHTVEIPGGMAFLPPSETNADVVPGTANGKIVVDVTVGQLYHFGKLLDPFGLVSSPVTVLVKNGIITDICGNSMAQRLKEKLFLLPVDCQTLVELGQGLSRMEPTGLIGVDESILTTCHFGFGDGGTCGVHLDLVVNKPSINMLMTGINLS